jgi:hypothetical protein
MIEERGMSAHNKEDYQVIRKGTIFKATKYDDYFNDMPDFEEIPNLELDQINPYNTRIVCVHKNGYIIFDNFRTLLVSGWFKSIEKE